MNWKLSLVILGACFVMAHADLNFLPTVSHLYSSCRTNPCEGHESCKDSSRHRHSYSCCYILPNGEPFCKHNTSVRNWKEIIPFTFSLMLILIFLVGVWCSLHYLLKKLFNLCLKIASSNKTRKLVTRIRCLIGKPVVNNTNTESNEIPIIIVPSEIERSHSPPPQYELPPAYENLRPKNTSKL